MDLQIRARAAAAVIDLATFGFNPGQRRGPDGRFIKMGGRGSAGPSRKAGERTSDRDVEVVPAPRAETPPIAAAEPTAPRTDRRPRTETYKGRKLRVARHPTRQGHLQTSINGTPVYTPIGTRPEDMDRELVQLRRDVDAADQRRAGGEPDAYPAAWYEGAPEMAPGPIDVAAPGPRRNPRMEELDRQIAEVEQMINEPGEEYLADRRRAELELQKKARAAFGDPLPGETDAEHEARVLSKIKGAVAVMDDAKAAGWQTAAVHSTSSSGMPFVKVGVRNPDTGETFEMSWHTQKNGTYQLFSQPMVTRVSDKGAFESGRGYGSTRTPTKLREIMAQEPAAGATPAPTVAAAVTPEIGPDGQYTKPVKQVATWNGQTETRTSRHPYKYASVVQVGDREPAIVSWHRTREAAEKSVLTKDQRGSGVRVVGVAEVKPEQPGENAAGSEAARLRKKRATLASDAGEFAMPDDLADYWIHGEGAAKIRWCTKGSFDRARRALREHVPAPMLDGTVANLYKRACGKWPGQDRD